MNPFDYEAYCLKWFRENPGPYETTITPIHMDPTEKTEYYYVAQKMTFPDLVEAELKNARAKHQPIQSAHEGYAVIAEEVEEFWDEVKKKRQDRDKTLMLHELVQLAAMARRTAEDCGLVPCQPDRAMPPVP
jgi:hypothetical protein